MLSAIKPASTLCVLLLLSACGGPALPRGSIGNFSAVVQPLDSKTFSYTGAEQSFTVPSGVRKITIVARGAGGAGYSSSPPSGDYPGRGGRVYAIVPVTPGETLRVLVGGKGRFKRGGYNGGGDGGLDFEDGSYGGGGATDVREGGNGLSDRIVVAGGGGGGGNGVPYGYGSGGNAGGLTGENGGPGGFQRRDGGGGRGGSQSAGGFGGIGGERKSKKAKKGNRGNGGSLGGGGNGGAGGEGSRGAYEGGSGGGGGGGGYYGGGGGGGGASIVHRGNRMRHGGGGGGGGGGSSYVEPKALKSRIWSGWKKANADGQVVITWEQ